MLCFLKIQISWRIRIRLEYLTILLAPQGGRSGTSQFAYNAGMSQDYLKNITLVFYLEVKTKDSE